MQLETSTIQSNKCNKYNKCNCRPQQSNQKMQYMNVATKEKPKYKIQYKSILYRRVSYLTYLQYSNLTQMET